MKLADELVKQSGAGRRTLGTEWFICNASFGGLEMVSLSASLN